MGVIFKNKSNDINNSKVYFFQKNILASPSEMPIAWKVIQNCGRGDSNPFEVTEGLQVGVTDSYGNVTPLLNAEPGEAFEVVLDSSGDVLRLQGNATSKTEVQIYNQLPTGVIT